MHWVFINDYIEKEKLEKVLEELRRAWRVNISVNSTGGDYLAALAFVEAVKKEGLETKINDLQIVYAGSAAAYIVLMLDKCRFRHLVSSGKIVIHGGRIEIDIPEFFLRGIDKKTLTYWENTLKLVQTFAPSKIASLSASTRVELAADECEKAGIQAY